MSFTKAVSSIKITTVVEDTSPKRLFKGEHGLSFWIEVDNKNILFDTGQSGEVLLENLKRLKLNIKSLDASVLSHPHDDHSGGIQSISTKINDLPFYCVSDVFDAYVPDRKRLKKILSDVQHINKDTEILPGVWIPRERNTVNTKYKTKEINLVINLKRKGLVVIVGCSHHGLTNIVNNAKSLFSNKIPIHALIGGFHLKDSPDKEITNIVNKLAKENIKIIAPNHCTGNKAIQIMNNVLPKQMETIINTDTATFHTGMTLKLTQ